MSTVATAVGSAWRVDPTHSHVEFAVRHLMISTVKGRFAEVSGRLIGDETDVEHASIELMIPVVRALQRRLLALAPARARVERGDSPHAVMTSIEKSLFFKDKALFQRLLTAWDAAGLATVGKRVGRLERELLFSKAPGIETLGEELVAIARRARRR